MDKITNIRWVLAHEPIELFLRAAKRFSADVQARTDGRFNVEVMTLSQYSERYNGRKAISKHDLLDLMAAGQIEMSQMYTTTLGRFHRDLHALDLPFLFRDHEHAARVLDGPVGRQLFEGLERNSEVHGLAFTYSGGYRMIAGNKPIHRLEDFAGLRVRIAKSEVAAETFRAVGAIPVPMELEEVNEALRDADVDGGESTYPRFYSMKQNEVAKVINDTRHSLFLTSIIVGKSLWKALDEETRQAFSHAARSAAELERNESVEDIRVIQEQCHRDGISVISLGAAEQARFAEKTKAVYSRFDGYFPKDLVPAILDA